MIAAVLLAAGASRRFGAPKLLELLSGVPIVRWSALALLDSRVRAMVVVVRPEDGPAIANALAGLPALCVENAHAEAGVGTSIARGIAALPAGASAAMLGLADEPLLRRAVVQRVIDRHAAGDAEIVAPRYRGVITHPVLFGEAAFPELAALDGDRGARGVVERDPSRVAWLDLAEQPAADIDTRADLALARERAQNMTSPIPDSD